MPLYEPTQLDDNELCQLGRAIAAALAEPGSSLRGAQLLAVDNILLAAYVNPAGLSPEAAFALVASACQHRVEVGDYTQQTADKLAQVQAKLATYLSRVRGIGDVTTAGDQDVRAFLLAPSSRPGAGLKPGPDLVNLRAWAAGVFFQELRRLGEYRCQPLVDFERPARTKGLWRPLSDAEVQRGHLHCRRHSLDTRGPAAWALGEATAGTAEIALVVVADLDLAAGTVWLSGTSRSLPRYGQLTDWGRDVLALRLEALGNEPAAPLVYRGRGTPQSQQASSCHVLFDILRRAGLGRDPLVKPASLRAWRGAKIFERTGDITAVAAALGYRSLDDAANAIGWAGPGPAEPPEHRRGPR